MVDTCLPIKPDHYPLKKRLLTQPATPVAKRVLVPLNAKWDATYQVTAPKPLFIAV